MAFVDEFDRRRAGWLAEWQGQNPRENTVERATQALRYLQFFDALSLWFCCDPLAEQEIRHTPEGTRLSLAPHGGGNVHLTPWPMTQPTVNIQIIARSVPRRPYESAEELAAVESTSEVLTWHLSPVR